MKIIVLSLLMFSLHADAQTLQEIKNSCLLQQYSKAKTDIDKAMQDAAFTAKPEAYILKTAVYSTLASNAIKADPAQAETLAAEADAAFTKYKEKDAAMPLLSDALYQNGPVNLYTVYYSIGYTDYSQKKWNTAFNKISRAVKYSDLLIQQKLLNAVIDTNVLVLAGIIAENSGNKDAAVSWYSRLADAGMKGEGYESVYRYLVSYYFTQKNYTLFEKYKSLGKTMYPSSEYFSFDKVDFTVGTVTGFDNQYTAVQALLKDDPGNFKANEILGEIIYDELTKRLQKIQDDAGIQQLESTMVAAFQKAAAAKPGYVNPFLYMGDYFINKAVTINDEKDKTTDAIKKKQLGLQYAKALDAAGEPYEKAAAIFATQTVLSDKDKAQYQKAAGYLADIALYKKATAASESDKTRWNAAAVKWNALAESIK